METNRLPPLRVLIVEDSEDDAELLLRKLRQGGYEPLHTRVETAEEMGAALRSGPWDLIVSDYRMPRFSGLQALALLRGTGLDVPFLIVSGNIGEDTAVEAMKAGAHDYIMKDRLQRLIPAIRRELKEAEGRRLRKQAEDALLKKHEELEAAHAELKQAQARVIQQEKMASIGQLAAGITHEINNPMSFITGNLGILKTYLESITKTIATQEEIAINHAPPEALEALQDLKKKMKIDYILKDVVHLIDQSLEGADRVRKIVSDLKTFSRMEEEAYMIEDINAALNSTINIVWNEIKYKAELVKEFGELPLTRCNISHLNQVFMNLLVNAAQAIEKWGKITVRTWTQGEDIYASVSDTGNGIPEENRKKIFEPFFTTKAAGKGTGLGLSISYDIVRRHNGDLTVESKVGEGTTFTVRIPIVRS